MALNVQNTIDEAVAYNAPGAMQYPDGGAATMMPPEPMVLSDANKRLNVYDATAKTNASIAASTAPVVPLTINEPTVDTPIGSALGFQPGNYTAGPTYEQIYGAPIDERQIQRNQMKLFQSEIDATNRIYDEQLANAKLQGQGRLGSQRAISARSGLLGSDFGAAQKEKVIGLNTSEQNAIQAERLAKIGSIMGNVRKAVLDEKTEKRLARQQGADNYLAYLKSSAERKTSNIDAIATDLLNQDIDPASMMDELEEIAKTAGVSVGEILSSYKAKKATATAEATKLDLETRKTESEIAKNKRTTVGEGTAVLDENGNVIYKNPKTYAPGTGSSGGFTSGGFSATADEVGEVTRVLDAQRGSDYYTDTGVYLNFFQQAVNGGALPQDFIKKFPPDLYLNPEDPTIPGYIKQEMQKVDLFSSI